MKRIDPEMTQRKPWKTCLAAGVGAATLLTGGCSFGDNPFTGNANGKEIRPGLAKDPTQQLGETCQAGPQDDELSKVIEFNPYTTDLSSVVHKAANDYLPKIDPSEMLHNPNYVIQACARKMGYYALTAEQQMDLYNGAVRIWRDTEDGINGEVATNNAFVQFFKPEQVSVLD